jgi:hypothetical protein
MRRHQQEIDEAITRVSAMAEGVKKQALADPEEFIKAHGKVGDATFIRQAAFVERR